MFNLKKTRESNSAPTKQEGADRDRKRCQRKERHAGEERKREPPGIWSNPVNLLLLDIPKPSLHEAREEVSDHRSDCSATKPISQP